MKTKKKVIRLTESELHNIIAKGVRQALNELDPRTYANAATKARERGDDRASKFKNAAIKSWNQKHGFRERVPNLGMVDYGQMQYDYSDNPTNDYEIRRGQYSSYGDEWENSDYFNATDNNIESWGDTAPENPQFGQGLKIAKQMAKGNGKYMPRKGWQ